ncbi:DNA invertase Pin-like site-specific DNA recombinase [Pseudomonas sp. BIGb0450]|uniref:recombinase family protein n=1 Tax=unclassified Pseudomonas TaxID=196821 RepID=UPI002168236A|nr:MULTISPECIES: recombinase family protein [unclassified Pseudomonas]MCS3417137.1 DNA invertase Pin-like site-specific DNA recombinase [Pseudomonas sp. BIGb0558]MCS3437156.1 DNA invertase Pin-like site-specific DNA recombinase [Pseudomonas sp. BIGb0450]
MARLISYLRMSTSEQLKGFSLERQRKLIADFASRNGLSLDESHSIEDIGRSSFSDDAEQKQLARFFTDLEAGKFSPGDVFALENIDRLTRRGPIDALLKVNTILSKGLKLAIISDKEQKILAEIDVFSIITLSIDASRANKESQAKSDKGLENWAFKRELAASHGVAMTAQAPAWLDTESFFVMDESKGKQIKRRRYVLNPDKAETVRLIFDLYQNGNGSLKIKNILNERNIPTFKGAEYWEPSIISKMLRNPATFGFYQPQKQGTGKRDLVPAGEPIEGYFPAIVSRETFEQCQRITAANTTRKGRKGKLFTNLFTGLLKCSICGGPVHLLNSGIDKRAKVPKSTNYLVCKKAKFTKECLLTRWRYDDFEAVMLKTIQEINLADVLNENNPLEQLIKKIRAIETKIEKNQKLLENFQKSFIETGDLPAFMIETAKNAENDNKALVIERTELHAQISQLNVYNTNVDNAIEELKDNGTYETRAKINLVLHEIINSMHIHFFNTTVKIEFKNGITRQMMKDVGVHDYNMDEMTKTMYAAAKEYTPQ